jgi:hypothetical protein
MTNMPIYRAKKIDSDKYIDGYYFHQLWVGDYLDKDAEEREEKINHFITGFTTHDIWDDEEGHFQFMGINEIDPSTLSIHFPDMLDSSGTKIFASLSEDGKGGDNVLYKDDSHLYTMIYNNHGIKAKDPKDDDWDGYRLNPRLKVVGIQQ